MPPCGSTTPGKFCALRALLVIHAAAAVVTAGRYSAVTGVNATDVSLETYLQLGSNNLVRLHSLLLASRLNRMMNTTTTNAAAAATACDDDDDDDDDDGAMGPFIRSSLLAALSTLPLRDVVSWKAVD